MIVDDLVASLKDSNSMVRMQAVQSISTCGGRSEIPALLSALKDSDWMVRQAAGVALQNISGLDLPFDALASDSIQKTQVDAWRDWSKSLVPNEVPAYLILSDSEKNIPKPKPEEHMLLAEKRLKQIRALGALGGNGASQHIIDHLNQLAKQYPNLGVMAGADWWTEKIDLRKTLQPHTSCMQVGVRALSRLNEDVGFEFVMKMASSLKQLHDQYFVRFAADALGEFGRDEAVPVLIKILESRVQSADGRHRVNIQDQASGGWESINDTAFFAMGALSRLPLLDENAELLRKQAHVIIDNLPLFHDNLFTYKRDISQVYAEELFTKIGFKEPMAELILAEALGEAIPETPFSKEFLAIYEKKGKSGTPMAWSCDDPKYTERLHKVLDVAKDPVYRIMAAKTLYLIGDENVADHVADLLAISKTEAEFGINPIWRMDEYNDPAVRWRAEFARLLGFCGDSKHIPLLIKIMNDERNVQEVRFRAGQALGRMGEPDAFNALQIAAVSHPIHSVKIYARDYLRRNGMSWEKEVVDLAKPLDPVEIKRGESDMPESIVYIEGDMVIPGYAFMDPWRQVYGFTDTDQFIEQVVI